MHILVPKFILNQVEQGKQYGEILAAGLFVDLTGFSTMTDTLMQLGQHGAEIMAEMMRQIFTPMIERVYRHHGFIATFAGDSFTALFPLDEALTGTNLHPIAAALEILQEIDSIPAPQTPAGTFDISVRIGMSIGPVHWGIIHADDETRAAYFFRGAAVAGCIEAQNQAKNGEIVLDKAAQTHYQGHLHTVPTEQHFRLQSPISPVPASGELLDTPFNLQIAQRFYPKSILTQNLMGEFRHVVNMFISLPTVRTAPQLEIFLQTLFRLQDRYGGLLNRIDFGDKGAHLMLFWGAPVAYENDIGRALNFTLSLQSETSIPINAGITYQIAHAGFIGSPLREEYTCYGRGPNLAARFMTKAPRGEVWLDEYIAKRVERYFEIEYEGELVFKGFEEKQKVYALFERRESESNFFSGEFLGRAKELETLADFAQPLEKSKSPVPVVLEGEPGVGKSRLAYEFLYNYPFINSDIRVARCQTEQVLRGSFNPFRYWTKNYFEVRDSNSESRNKRNFNRRLDRLIARTEAPNLAAELDRTRSFLGSLVNLFWDDSLYAQLEPQARYENTIIGLTTLLKAESLLQPVVLLIEDLQWMDADSRVFLQQLYRSLHANPNETFPLFILATSRTPDTQECLGKGIPYKSLPLSPLPEKSIQRLAADLLGGSAIHPQLAGWLTKFSEGNPLYTEQIVRYLQEENQLTETSLGWQLIESNASFLPADTRALLVARLDQIATQVKHVVLSAATLGREFNTHILTHMLPTHPSLEENLQIAQQAAIWSPISELAYAFRSNLFRDTAYRMQTHAQRRLNHRKAVEALEEVQGQELSRFYPELAYHSENAGLFEKSRRYYQLAGEAARQSYQNQQAIYYFSKALDLSEDYPPDPFIVNLLLSRENTYNRVGLRENQHKDLEQAQTYAIQMEDPLLLAQVYNRWARYYHLTGEYQPSIEYAQKAISIANAHNDPKIEVSARNHWANSSRHQGDYSTTIEQASKSLEIAQQNNDRIHMSVCLNILSLSSIEQGNYNQAIDLLQQSLETARQSNDFGLEAQTLNNLGNVYGEIGDYSSAYQVYTQAQAISQKIGSRMGVGFTTTNLGWIAGILGNYAAAKQHLEDSIRISQELGDHYIQAYSLLNLSLFTSPEEESVLAKDYAQQGLAMLKEIGHRPGVAVGFTYLGHALAALGLYEEAQQHYQQSLNIRQELGQENLSMESIAGLAEVERATRGAKAALSLVSKILTFLENGGTLDGIDQPFRIHNVCAKVLLENDPPSGEAYVKKAHTLLQEKAEKIKDQDSRKSFLKNVPCHQELENLYTNIFDNERQSS